MYTLISVYQIHRYYIHLENMILILKTFFLNKNDNILYLHYTSIIKSSLWNNFLKTRNWWKQLFDLESLKSCIFVISRCLFVFFKCFTQELCFDAFCSFYFYLLRCRISLYVLRSHCRNVMCKLSQINLWT